jgi:hypothetical protein
MATTTRMNRVKRIGVRVLHAVRQAQCVPGPKVPAAGRDELARLGLLTVGKESGCDELSRLALRSFSEGERRETGLFAQDV